ncbi:MAG: glycoside hydrolase family 3 C-terminal domain-containing protein [Clostridiales bacterium]|nr:glycoside hydrolase family 3 C-terminal domain-containing protein [Clostridiales bacterium]MCC8098595.1 glycoside hydrolase family 3 C-terminal domain-containing protein [Clostridiales bacterium]
MKRKVRTFSGSRDSAVSAREVKNRAVALKAAEEGIALLKNDGVLPLEKGTKVALFGSGAGHTIKGGTGSGDVNERDVVSIYQGMVNAGFDVTSADWICSFDQIYRQSREDWKNLILQETGEQGPMEFFAVYASHAYEMPAGRAITQEDFGGAKTAVYVVSRIAGEAADRFDRAGDYYLTEHEKEDLRIISENSETVIVVLNAGGQIDMQDILSIENVKAILSVVQPGMEGGNALARILSGEVTPSGKLTETWAKKYEDFPNSASFSHNNGNVQKEKYEEGIYVGYRYFDSFQKEVEYPFGFGLSYTAFELSAGAVTAEESTVTVPVTVKNTGACYAGKEVVQIYATCPQSGLPKEYKRLCGFAKTGLLQPGDSETLTISFPAKALASFDESRSAWAAEAGLYGIWAGNSSQNIVLVGVLAVKADAVIEEVKHICPLREELNELVRPDAVLALEAAWHREAEAKGITPVVFAPEREVKIEIPNSKLDQKASEVVEQLSDEELTAMVIGEVSKGQGALGAAGIMVPGAAGETSGALEAKWDVPGISMADGPAGLRLFQNYQVSRETGEIYNSGLLAALEGGFFAEEVNHADADTYYQYCTAIPVGTLLAQTWDTKLLEEVGQAVAVEMQEFGVAWWLAPGMNIQRNPLCGRNFEYYSEDPIVSGKMAAAITRGVQSVPGVGTTIKHFVCNNQEDNRMGSDSILSERALRELYLRGFELAVKEAQPMAIMTSYNLINGVHAANNYDTCTVAAREEWNFQGIIMTDWTTTENGSEAWKCAAAGNDLIMPGCDADSQNILAALADGRLDRDALKGCVKRMLKVIYQTLGYEDCVSYGAQFE